ncbi:hypothetical protein STCU_12317 [Strigomonas culicis]|uniref:Uncharacterized protein n=1 Tax=Strigomonas culicis TaxID=28005 RepID=S9UKI2_9TRYP|nr:hypothetical protein STCU_12317 [Strigomonas culicis]|eukprot:EPY15146.1 hypothetical protein STCU_12317 [Strigomonas culicis]
MVKDQWVCFQRRLLRHRFVVWTTTTATRRVLRDGRRAIRHHCVIRLWRWGPMLRRVFKLCELLPLHAEDVDEVLFYLFQPPRPERRVAAAAVSSELHDCTPFFFLVIVMCMNLRLTDSSAILCFFHFLLLTSVEERKKNEIIIRMPRSGGEVREIDTP